MSIANILSSLIEGKEIREKIQIGLEFSTKASYYSMLYTLIKNDPSKKLLNFDINFYKYLIQIKKLSFSSNHTNIFCNTKEELLIYYTSNKEKFNSNIYVIVGLDLLSKELSQIVLTKLIRLMPKYLVVFSLEKNFLNLSNEIESKKNNMINVFENYVVEKSKKIKQISSNKTNNNSNNNNINESNTINRGVTGDLEFYLMDCHNFIKSTVEMIVFEYKIIQEVNASNIPIKRIEFENVSMYKKEHKDVFEINDDKDNIVEQPSSTFNLNINENEVEARNKVILPYLKDNNENLIQVDQDDLNELYEEDPDEDLDI